MFVHIFSTRSSLICPKTIGALKCLYRLNNREKNDLSKKVEKYALEEFSYNKTIRLWDESLDKTINNHQKNKTRSSLKLIDL